MYINWISTVSLIALNKRGVKIVYRVSTALLAMQIVIQHRFIKSFIFQLGKKSHSDKNKGRLN